MGALRHGRRPGAPLLYRHWPGAARTPLAVLWTAETVRGWLRRFGGRLDPGGVVFRPRGAVLSTSSHVPWTGVACGRWAARVLK